jgi:hypothetical protein
MKRVLFTQMFGVILIGCENLAELFEKYGDCVALIYEKRIIGIGQTIEAAELDAESKLAPEIDQVTPITYFIANPRELSSACVIF